MRQTANTEYIIRSGVGKNAARAAHSMYGRITARQSHTGSNQHVAAWRCQKHAAFCYNLNALFSWSHHIVMHYVHSFQLLQLAVFGQALQAHRLIAKSCHRPKHVVQGRKPVLRL